MPIHDHEPSFQARPSCGRHSAGVLFLTGLLTHGFGLFSGPARARSARADGAPGRPDRRAGSSALRKALTVEPATARPVNAQLVLPAVVESDPARTTAVLTPLSGRLVSLRIALGDRVKKVRCWPSSIPPISAGLRRCAKAADTFRLADKNLERQVGQHGIGAASDKDLDQAKSDRARRWPNTPARRRG